MVKALDELDRRLLELLAADARTPVAGLAAALGVARSTVQTRLGRLERDGVIAGYTIRLGDEVEAPLRAQVAVVADGRQLDGVLAALTAMGDVRRIWTTSGEVDLLVEVACRTSAQLDHRIDRIAELPGVRRTTTTLLLAKKLERE